jgi:hypothetical protein
VLSALTPPPAALDDPVVWALLVVILVLAGVLGLFLRWFAREAAYWRQAYFDLARQNREVTMPTAEAVLGVLKALPDPGPPGRDRR